MIRFFKFIGLLRVESGLNSVRFYILVFSYVSFLASVLVCLVVGDIFVVGFVGRLRCSGY